MSKQSEVCKIAVVGAGNMAREHIKVFRALPGVSVVGITSRTRDRAEALAAEFDVPLVCDSVAELYEKTEAHLVVVTVFELAMFSVARECFRYPWTLLLEKPAGYTYDIANDLAKASKEAGRRTYVALNRRFNSSSLEAMKKLHGDATRYIRVQDQQDLGVARAFNHPQEVVENWMYANSIHLVDYLRYFGRGKVVSVERITTWNPASPGVVLAHVHFDSGDIGLYEGIWNGPGPWAVSIASPDMRVELRPLEQGNYQLRGERKLNPFAIDPCDSEYKAGFYRQAEMAVRAARGEPSESVSIDEALESMALVKSIFGLRT